MRYIFFLSLLSVVACLNPPDYAIEPEIEYTSINKNILRQGFGNDTLQIAFYFTDGDGDLGSDSTENIFLMDSRTGNLEPYVLPIIPPRGRENAISGDVTIDYYSTCCIVPNEPIPCTPSETHPTDTFFLEIYIEDQAGHRSNIIRTEDIVLLCE